MLDNLIGAFFVLAFVFVPLERIFALRKSQPIFRKGWFNDAIHFFVNHFLVQLGVFALAVALIVLFRRLVNSDFQAAVAAQPQWLQFLEAVLIADITFYFIHRMAHTIPWLWKFHAIHHSIEEMDWLASARLHPIDQILSRGLVILPLYLMGFSATTFGVYLVLAQFQALLVHSNVRFKFGPLRWFFSTPEFHHWHHANEPAAINKNYAGQLPLLDLLFGTLYMPKGQMPGRYGINDYIPMNYVKQLAYPFRKS